jgi:hypothetical protein
MGWLEDELNNLAVQEPPRNIPRYEPPPESWYPAAPQPAPESWEPYNPPDLNQATWDSWSPTREKPFWEKTLTEEESELSQTDPRRILEQRYGTKTPFGKLSPLEQYTDWSKFVGSKVTEPFRGETPYTELPSWQRMISEAAEPIMWIDVGGKGAVTGTKILAKLLKEGIEDAPTILKKLAEGGIKGIQAEKLIDEVFTNFSKYIKPKEQTKMAQEALINAKKLVQEGTRALPKTQGAVQGMLPKSVSGTESKWKMLPTGEYERELFHGSRSNVGISELKTKGESVNSTVLGEYGTTRHGLFLTDNPEVAKSYGDNLLKVNIKIKKLANLDGNIPYWEDFVDTIDAFKERDLWLQTKGVRHQWQHFENKLGERFTEYLKKKGFDGAMFDEYTTNALGGEISGKTHVVFDKSALSAKPISPTSTVSGGTTKPPTPPPSEAGKALEGAGGIIPPKPIGEVVKDIQQGVPTLGVPQKYTVEESDNVLKQLADLITSPSVDKANKLTILARNKAIAERVNLYSQKMQQLLAEGMGEEEAFSQAIKEMKGKLPSVQFELFDALTDQMREAAFGKLRAVLKDEPLEEMSTVTALRRLFEEGRIPKDVGTKEGSAYTRLLRVFSPEFLESLNTGKPIKKTLEDLVRSSKPQDIDKEMAEYLRKLSSQGEQLGQSQEPFPYRNLDIKSSAQRELEHAQLEIEINDLIKPKQPVLGELGLSDTGAKAPLMFPRQQQNIISRILKEIGFTVVDIGNFLRANKASGDLSYWRQTAPFIVANPMDFAKSNLAALKALKSDAFASQTWKNITKSPLYQLYEQYGLDFLRAYEIKGAPQWKLAEEFAFVGGDRPIPKFAAKVPWIKISERGFVTGVNSITWKLFTEGYEFLLKRNERLAMGLEKLKPGEVFNMEATLKELGKMLAAFSGRGSLGKFQEAAPIISALAFAPKMAVGRIISPKFLLSSDPYVFKTAWKNLGAFVAFNSSLLLLGKATGIWDVNTDKNSTDFMKIRIGNTRIDPWGGYQQYAVLYDRLGSMILKALGIIPEATSISTATGKEYDLELWGLLGRAGRGKLAPLPGLVAEFITGKTFLGKKLNYLDMQQNLDRFMTLGGNDLIDAYTDNIAIGVLVTLPTLLGFGVQTYKPEPKKEPVKVQPKAPPAPKSNLIWK